MNNIRTIRKMRNKNHREVAIDLLKQVLEKVDNDCSAEANKIALLVHAALRNIEEVRL